MVGVLGIEPRLASSKPAVMSHYTTPQQIKQDRIKLVLPLHQTFRLRSRTAPLLFKSIVVFNFAVTILKLGRPTKNRT